MTTINALVCDVEPNGLEVFTLFARKSGFSVQQATTREQALKKSSK